jgi:hypothetical protein
MRLSFFAALAVALVAQTATAPSASAQPPPPRQARALTGWNGAGWVFLGEKRVGRGTDTDVIRIPRSFGAFTDLTLGVADADLELLDLTVVFRDGSTVSPELRTYFKEGSRAREFSLPGQARFISEVRLTYKNVPGKGRARVQLYGKRGQVTAPSGPTWNPQGWVMLGETKAGGGDGFATVRVGKEAGVFTQITMVVVDKELFANNLMVTYDNNRTMNTKLNQALVEGSRTRTIDLPGGRALKNVRVGFDKIADVGKATIQIWGRTNNAGFPPPGAQPAPLPAPAPPPPPVPAFDPRGWNLLGETRVEGRRDHDIIRLPPGKMAMRRIVIVVSDSDLDMQNVQIRYGKGQVFTPNVRHFFREGQRSRVIDLPGEVTRVFEVELKYGNTPGGGRARVQVYGQ